MTLTASLPKEEPFEPFENEFDDFTEAMVNRLL